MDRSASWLGFRRLLQLSSAAMLISALSVADAASFPDPQQAAKKRINTQLDIGYAQDLAHGLVDVMNDQVTLRQIGYGFMPQGAITVRNRYAYFRGQLAYALGSKALNGDIAPDPNYAHMPISDERMDFATLSFSLVVGYHHTYTLPNDVSLFVSLGSGFGYAIENDVMTNAYIPQKTTPIVSPYTTMRRRMFLPMRVSVGSRYQRFGIASSYSFAPLLNGVVHRPEYRADPSASTVVHAEQYYIQYDGFGHNVDVEIWYDIYPWFRVGIGGFFQAWNIGPSLPIKILTTNRLDEYAVNSYTKPQSETIDAGVMIMTTWSLP